MGSRVAVRALALAAVANAALVTGLWVRAGGVAELDDGAGALVSAGRLTGLLGAYLALLAVVLLARVPVLDRALGLGRLTAWHRRLGRACLVLLLAHAALITAGYAAADGRSVPGQVAELVRRYPGVITAIAALVLLVAVAAASVVVVRRRLRYETWYFVHLYTYLAIALGFSHQLATGREFVGDPVARAYWVGLYVATLGAVVVFRLGLPLARSARHRLRVERVVREGPGVVSVEVGGRRLERLRARAVETFGWRFLTRDRWWEAHPFSLSAAPDGRRLRITVKDLGDFSGRLGALAPGTRVVVEGPYGGFGGAGRGRRPRGRVALIAGGVGITPIRALLEDLPGEPGDIAVLYRAAGPDEVILRGELDALAARRRADVHYLVGDRARDLLSPERLRGLVPDIAARDVYVCGSPAMTAATALALRGAGVARRRITVESFGS
jgi:predicted ferric reductase